MRLVLGSGSPRRKEILSGLGFSFSVDPPSIDETPLANEPWRSYLERVVRAKFEAVLEKHLDAVVLVADTSVIADEEILGKPATPADASAMLVRLSGRTHLVATRFLVGAQDRPPQADTVITEVDFRVLDPDEIERYVATGEGADKAGAYAIQGGAALFVSSIRGSYTNVVGLPGNEVRTALLNFGVARTASQKGVQT